LKFQLHLSRTLIDAGYRQSINDECLFYKRTTSGFSYISTHSDDFLLCCSSKTLAQEFRSTLIKTYNDIVYNEHASSYIGMSIKRSSDLSKLYISQNGLTNRIIADFLPDNFPTAASPASSHLFNNVSTGPSYDRIKYLSLIMAMMYVARLTRPDILLSISFLATKSQQPTDADYNNALRVLAYLKSTSNYGIIIKCQELKLHIHCDASWASHHDGNSHTGWLVKMGQSYLGCKSGKQRVGSPSSTDAEIIATSDALKNLKWLDNLLIEINLPTTISHLYQDNLSASKVIMKQTKTKQLKHLLSKINLAQQYHADKLFEIIQTPTDEMIADSLTKPKSAYNYIIVEAARLGVYKMPNN